MVVKDASLKTVSGNRRIEAVSVETSTILVGVSVDTRYNSGVGRDTDNSNRAQGKGWIRPGNDGRVLPSNPNAARWIK